MRAAIQSKAPRRTCAAIAASTMAQAFRLLQSGDVGPAAAPGGLDGAAYAAGGRSAGAEAAARDGAALAPLRAKRAAQRKRRKAAKRGGEAMDVEVGTMPVDEGGPSGAGGAPGPQPAVAPMDTEPPAGVAAGSSTSMAVRTVEQVQLGSGAPGQHLDAPPSSQQPAHGFAVGDQVCVIGGEFECGSGRIAAVGPGSASIVVPSTALFHDCSPINVAFGDLVHARRGQAGAAHPRRRLKASG